MSSKNCTKCGVLKPLSEFRYRSNTRDNRTSHCKSCDAINSLARKQTRDGLVVCMIQNQRNNSKHRGHEPPPYTLKELREWVFSQPNFDALYENWVQSGYAKYLIPSCDRTNDSLGYSLERLYLTTWEDNNARGSLAISAGTSRGHTQKPVRQLSLVGTTMRAFPSATIAAKETGACRTTILGCCKGINQSSGGFKWEYI